MRSTKRLAGLAGLAALAAVAGCGADDRPAKWSFISATITEPSCATVNCHSAITQRAGVDLHEREIGYHTLIGRLFVIPGDIADSEMVSLMNAQGTTRMPPDLPLSDDDINLIERWIAAGAPND